MKAPKDMQIYHESVLKGTEIVLKKEPWVNEKYKKNYLDFLDGILSLNSDVLEFGSGGSTFYIAERVKRITTFEYDEVWYKIMQEEIAKKGMSNIVIHFDPDYPENFHCTKPCFDVVINDVWNDPFRKKLIETGMNCLRPNGCLIYHNNESIDKLMEEGWVLLKNWGKPSRLATQFWKTAWKKP